MKELLIGVGVGVAIGYVVRKMVEEGKFDCVCNDFSQLADKTKKKVKDVVDTSINQAEYIADRVEHVTGKVAKKNN